MQLWCSVGKDGSFLNLPPLRCPHFYNCKNYIPKCQRNPTPFPWEAWQAVFLVFQLLESPSVPQLLRELALLHPVHPGRPDFDPWQHLSCSLSEFWYKTGERMESLMEVTFFPICLRILWCQISNRACFPVPDISTGFTL